MVKNKIIGVTCHNSIKLAKKALLNGANYIALGSFYKTKTKKVIYKANTTTLNKIKKSLKIPVVAVGGINERNYKYLLLNKADFLAISGYIWKNKKLGPLRAIENKMKINATEIKVGMILEYKNDLWEVLKTNHVKPGKGGAFAQDEMKSLNKSTKLNERFRSSETVEKASLEEIKYNFLYKDDSDYYFIDPNNFEQISLNKDLVGEKGKLLYENLEVSINFHDENPLNITLPNQIICKIDTTDAAIKGQTVSSSYKPAKLNNGVNIQVPPFIESGDTILIDTRTMEYVKKI